MSNYHIKTLKNTTKYIVKVYAIPKPFGKKLPKRTFCLAQTMESVLHWDFTKPEIKWFEGAELNITENCIDRHLATERR